MRMHLVSFWLMLVATATLGWSQARDSQKVVEKVEKAEAAQTSKVKKSGKQGVKPRGSKTGGSKTGGPAAKAGAGKSKTNTKAKPGTVIELPVDTKDAREKGADDPIPDGATEEDIRAIRGANTMLKVEKRLKSLLRKLNVKGDAEFLRFSKIDSWIYEDGFQGMPKSVKKLDGKQFVMAGFMLPIDEVENIKSFYLVESLWSCCFGMPPDVNGLVRVEVKAKDGIAYHYDPILVVGTFELKKTMDEDYVVCIYTLEADKVTVLDLDDK